MYSSTARSTIAATPFMVRSSLPPPDYCARGNPSARVTRAPFLFLSVCGFLRGSLRHPALRVVPFFPAAIVGVPDVGQLADGSRLPDRLKFMHRIQDDTFLQLGSIGFARLVAERKIDKHSPWRLDGPGYVECRGHGQSWNPGLFDYARYQSDGLMAHGSGGYQVES